MSCSEPAAERRHVAVFGLSANPPTGAGGHGGVVAAARRAADEVWVLPVFTHAFADKAALLAPFDARLELCRLGLGDERASPEHGCPVKVCDTERLVWEAARAAQARGVMQLRARASLTPACLLLLEQASSDAPPRVGTVDTFNYLEAAHPDTRFSFVLGADTFADLLAGKWKDSSAFLSRASLLVVPRVCDGPPCAAPPLPDVASAPHAQLLAPLGLTGVSSSAARAALARGDVDAARAALHPAVLDAVMRLRLYGTGDIRTE